MIIIIVALFFIKSASMKTTLHLITASACIFLLSCSSYAKKKFKLERKFNFESKEDFKKYIYKNRLFPEDNILYIDTSSLYGFFVDKMKGGSAGVYLGTYLNDSSFIKSGSFLEENTSCKGRVEDEILRNVNLKEIPDSIVKKGKKMSSYKLYHLSNNKLFDINKHSKRHKVFLMYAHAFGTYYDSMYKEVLSIQQKNSSEVGVFIVVADPVQMLK